MSFFFFFQKIFPFFSRTSIYMLSTSFHAKNAEIVFWSKFLATRTKGHFWTRFNWFPCPPFKWFFNLFHGPLKYAIYKFCAKTPPLYSNQNYSQVGHRIFFFFFCNIFFYLFFGPLYMQSISFHVKMPTSNSGKNSSLVGPRGIFEQNLTKFVFLTKDFSNCFLDL